MTAFTLDRRAALRGLGCAMGAAAFPGLACEALARAPTDRRLIFILLRGGMDGLGAVPPLGDRNFANLRDGLRLSAKQALEIDDGFGLHPALKTLHGLYEAGEALALHAICSPYRDRSHFDGQDVLETGGGDVGRAEDGWLNRALQLMDARPGLGAGTEIPLAIRGAASVQGVSPRGLRPVSDALMDRLALVDERDPLLTRALAEGRAGAAAVAAARAEDDEKRADSADARLADTVGRLLAAPDGPRVAAFAIGGWDTHIRQGTTTGALARQLGVLDGVIAAFRDALGRAWGSTAILVATEFGRTVRPNGSGGTDHGVGGAAFALGGGVRGGRVVADWPGLSANALYEGRDLAPTADLRDLFAAALVDHIGLGANDVRRAVFRDAPDLKPMRGLFS